MAKSKAFGEPSPSTSGPIPTGAQGKLATLRRYYALGLRASETAPDGTTKEAEPLHKLAAEAGVREDTIRKAQRFATTYSAADLEQLLALRSPKGEPPSWHLVRVLLQVEDRAQRIELQSKAIEEGWSRRDLQAVVQQRQGGKKSTGGRRYDVPKSPQQALERLIELSESWLRFYEDIGEEGGLAEKLRSAKRRGGKTAGLGRATRETVARLRLLRAAAAQLADRLEEIELERGATVRGSRGSRGGKAETQEG